VGLLWVCVAPRFPSAVVNRRPMSPRQCSKISGNAVVCIVTTEHWIEVIRLLLDWQVPHPSHLLLRRHERTPQAHISTNTHEHTVHQGTTK
jgi:hypothetical protein